MRIDLFTRKPPCEVCESQGRVTPATIHHRIPLAEVGADDVANEQAIREPCHIAKTRAESARMRWAWGGYEISYATLQRLHPAERDRPTDWQAL